MLGVLDVLVLGGGRIGGQAARMLVEEGLRVGVADVDRERLSLLERRLGVEAVRGGAGSEEVLRAASRAGVVAVALPGRVAYAAVRLLLGRGLRVVDASFYPEDPWSLEHAAAGSLYVPDAGVAPGLSSMLAARADALLGGAEHIDIYVGGLSRDPAAPLGLAATWSAEDLVEEYLRPARMRLRGRLVAVDPLSHTGIVEIPGSGRFEYFASDGLRTLLRSLGHVDTLRELTLRHPGHLDAMRLLRRLGLLSRKEVEAGGCRLPAHLVLARLLEERLPRSGDRLVLYVEARRGRERLSFRLDVEGGPGETAMSVSTGAFLAAAAVVGLEGLARGFFPPERLGMDEALFSRVMGFLEKRRLRPETVG